MRISSFLFACISVVTLSSTAWGKSGVPFDPLTDVHYEEIELTFLGICVCQKGPYTEIGQIWTYWEPFVAVDTVTTPYYSPFLGMSFGAAVIDELGGKNASQDAVSIANESTSAQAHVFPISFFEWLPCRRHDNPFWMTEYDPQWQYDELSLLIHPEAALYANAVMQMACMTDAAATNLGAPLDAMPWCIGSGGSSYPMTGHVDNDNIVQANNTAAARLIYKLNRILQICDPAMSLCGCVHTPVWVKSHYKMHVDRPGVRSPARPLGVNAALYNVGLNTPYAGALGPNDEFLWTVYRRQLCCTCCD